MKAVIKFALAAAFGSALLFNQAAADPTIKIGVVGENNEQWKPIIEKLKDEGVTLELVKFNDYSIPNRALEDKEIDLHACMTGRFLNTESNEHNYHLTAIGTTLIAPLGIFSKKIKSLDELKEGDTFAVPSDPITTGRALRLLEAQKIISLKKDAGWTPNVQDIEKIRLKSIFTLSSQVTPTPFSMTLRPALSTAALQSITAFPSKRMPLPLRTPTVGGLTTPS